MTELQCLLLVANEDRTWKQTHEILILNIDGSGIHLTCSESNVVIAEFPLDVLSALRLVGPALVRFSEGAQLFAIQFDSEAGCNYFLETAHGFLSSDFSTIQVHENIPQSHCAPDRGILYRHSRAAKESSSQKVNPSQSTAANTLVPLQRLGQTSSQNLTRRVKATSQAQDDGNVAVEELIGSASSSSSSSSSDGDGGTERMEMPTDSLFPDLTDPAVKEKILLLLFDENFRKFVVDLKDLVSTFQEKVQL